MWAALWEWLQIVGVLSGFFGGIAAWAWFERRARLHTSTAAVEPADVA